jgi:hypothetical protein
MKITQTIKNLFFTTIIAASLALSTGCVSVPKDPVDRAEFIAELAQDVRDVAEVTTTIVLLEKPERNHEFYLAAQSLLVVESSDKVNVDMVVAILEGLKLEELESPKVKLYITGGKIVVRRLVRSLEVDNTEEVKLFAKALRQGIEAALKP